MISNGTVRAYFSDSKTTVIDETEYAYKNVLSDSILMSGLLPQKINNNQKFKMKKNYF